MKLTQRVNSSNEIAGVAILSESAQEFSGVIPITATPAAVAAGVGAGAALVGAVAAGAGLGEAID